jgi:hypothetical protein
MFEVTKNIRRSRNYVVIQNVDSMLNRSRDSRTVNFTTKLRLDLVVKRM